MAEERRYSDFDLIIEGAGDEGYRARVVQSPAGQAAGSFSLPFSTLELENFLLKVGRPRRGVRRLESPEMEAARDFGTQLFDAVFQDDLKLSLRRSLDKVESRDEGLRIRLWFSEAPELASLPWEFLYSESDDQFLVLSAWTPIVRYLDLTRPIEPLTVTGPLRILAMISSPHDYPTLDVEEEWHRIEDSLRPLIERGAVAIDRIEDATLLGLQRQLRKSRYHIFHFLGHGGFDEKAGDGVLVMEDGDNRSRLVAGRDLGTILNDHRSLRLAVLNACEGGRASDEDPFSGAAQSLVKKGIPAVVAMQFEITDDAAIAFAQEFYGAIADTYPVDAAIGEARRAIFGLGNDIEWGTPVVYLRGDGRLFDVETAPEAPPAVAVEESVDGSDPEPVPESVTAQEAPKSQTDDPVTGVAVAAASATTEEPVPNQSQTADADVADTPRVSWLSSVTAAALALPLWARLAGAGIAVLAIGVLVISLFPSDSTGTATTGGTTPPDALIAPDATATAARAETPLVIDANDTDWPEAVLHTTDHIIYNAPEVEDGTVARAGEENDSLIRLAWDESFLYLYAEVQDDVLNAPNQGNQIWRNDAVNLNISVIGPDGAVSERPDADDHQLTLSPGDLVNGTGAESLRFVGDGISFNQHFTSFADLEATRFEDGNYVIEARIKWSDIGVAEPQPGDRFGMIVTVFDNDGEIHDGSWLQAEIKANTPGAVFQRPQTWGTFTLDE